MRVVWLVVATGCSFSAGAAPHALDAEPDAPADARADAHSAASCRVGTANQLDDSGRIGDSNGGSLSLTPLACNAPTDSIVGVALRVSEGTTGGGARSSLAIDLACAALTIEADGTASLGLPYTNEAAGNGGSGWLPADLTSTAMCAPASVLSGLEVHSGPQQSLFVNVTITCAQIANTGAPTGMAAAVYIQGSLTEPSHDQTITCSAGRIIRELDPYLGAGLDAVEVRCAPAMCIP